MKPPWNEIRRMNLDAILQRSPVETSMPSRVQVLPPKKRAMQFVGRLARIPVFNKTLRRLYNFLFEYYAQEK